MGREFIDIFEDWAKTYDESVGGNNLEYREVFENYESILNAVAENSNGVVLEFGVGTGNLSTKLLQAGHQVVGIEPSKSMRDVASKKLPNLKLLEGDFLSFPELPHQVDTITSTYAFHHLTDVEKETAIQRYFDILPIGGKIVFGDTMFKSEEVKEAFIQNAKDKGYNNLAEDLAREYYPTIEFLRNIFIKFNFDVRFKQMNDFVWLVTAIKSVSAKTN
ncbi:class I SAM-dependent methyltransferase [Virgibacillus sp. C22-A2]|uniref:Uncharacterized methyltransferase QGM71_09520 n=1 Tax=Virgibacillus tibetensis TaxID=3042313 RepID=A0ABU6KF57_9BACI|nr:class I SAM-dependent methyltransferase [Virgibacillus sp. C22-A2]